MSKERLEEIKERYMEHEYDYALSAIDIDWLIEQAKRVPELEEENERLRALDIATTHELNHVDKINKRYRSILENVELTAQNKGYDDIYNFLVEELESEE